MVKFTYRNIVSAAITSTGGPNVPYCAMVFNLNTLGATYTANGAFRGSMVPFDSGVGGVNAYAIAGAAAGAFGLGKHSEYFTEYSTFYSVYEVLAVKFHVRIMNVGTSNLVVGGFLWTDDSALPSVADNFSLC